MSVLYHQIDCKCLSVKKKKKSFLMSLTKTNISPDLICGSWFATHGLIPEIYILKLGRQRFFKMWLQFTSFPPVSQYFHYILL